MKSLINSIYDWFAEAYPKKTPKTLQVQMGVHFEEVAEMISTLKGYDDQAQALLDAAYDALDDLGTHLKKSTYVVCDMRMGEHTEFLDALCDQTVTAIGCAYHAGMDINGALKQVDDSNYSKFVDGKAIFDENGKIAKGPDYFKPVLKPFTR